MIRLLLLALALVLLSLPVRVVQAQDTTPPTPTGPLGEIRGTVVDQNNGKVVAQTLDVMLHVLDLDYADKDMVHGQSQADGSFVFADVPFDANTQFSVMATYDGVTYFSETAPADMVSLNVALDVPVYETTNDLAAVQIDQMHVLLEPSTDGLETKELYIVSNYGQRTVKDVIDLGDGKLAVLKFPLPKDADYIFFQPDDKDRFVKLDGEFADTYPILPGDQPSQIMTSYLVPYSGERTYTYTAPVNVARMNFVLPEDSNISISGEGLTGPETTTLKDGQAYMVYSYENLKAGQTLKVSFAGAGTKTESNNPSRNNFLAIGAAFLGFGIIGAGIWWWRRPEPVPVEAEQTIDEIIAEIARLDETYEQQGLSMEEYQLQRKALMHYAKKLM